MPDTGAPHFIPFADPTDLVRDWPALSEDVAEAVADGLDEAGNAGIGSNVVTAVKTDPQSTSVSAGATTPLVGLSATITPSSTDSRILVLYYIVGAGASNSRSMGVILRRDASAIAVGDSSGSRRLVTTAVEGGGFLGGNTTSGIVLDSPNTDQPVEYDFLIHNAQTSTATLLVNRTREDDNNSRNWRATSAITLIEVAP